MSKVLLTFLGRVAKTERGYRLAKYDFGDGTVEAPTAFFGWSLQRRLAPDRLVILGTAGSMWDYLFEGEEEFAKGGAASMALLEAVEHKRVTPDELAPLVPVLNARLGCEVQLQIIPYARDKAEQVALLRIMAEQVRPGDHVELDVTHGFRHLPMLAILSALHLRSVRRAKIGSIWYGAFDPDTGEGPVHDLSGLLHIADWLQALNTYDKDGDYGAFAPLLGPAGEVLREAAFFERSSNPVKAREKLTGWVNRADRVPADDPAAELFSDALHERIRWYRGSTRAAWERALAEEYLARGDYVRAAIYGLESVISAEADRREGTGTDYDIRDQAAEALGVKEEFRRLKKIRNALAHGVRPRDKQITRIIRDEQALCGELHDLLKVL
ncbi:MAG: TIGR02221 family CRISPR-associated protein [Thiohalocapsa sp.]|nr:TIGR02221 family CRISPR-associated protein [Thiohalocapsa sp.]